jgi:hypothetical protein
MKLTDERRDRAPAVGATAATFTLAWLLFAAAPARGASGAGVPSRQASANDRGVEGQSR